MGLLQRLHGDIARPTPLPPHDPAPLVRQRRTARPRAPALGTKGQSTDAEKVVE